jgi:hypothetical protein
VAFLLLPSTQCGLWLTNPMFTCQGGRQLTSLAYLAERPAVAAAMGVEEHKYIHSTKAGVCE